MNVFNVFIHDLLPFIKETNTCNFADNRALYGCGKVLDTISNKVEVETHTAIKCLKDNEMVANLSKFQFMFLSNYKSIERNMPFDGKTIKALDTAELLGIFLDKNISFKKHIQNNCHQANNKTKGFFGLRKSLNLIQTEVLATAYISSIFKDCPLIWLGCGEMSDNLTKPITERLEPFMIHKHDHMKNYSN